TYTIPPATTGAGPFIEPPRALTPFSVWNSWLLSYSQTIDPSFVENARTAPSIDGENTTPGMTVIAADCAPLQPRPALHFTGGGGVNHARSPVASLTAWRPPGVGLLPSATGKYACSASTAAPHSMPPSAPPFPARYSQTIAPCLSGSIAYPMPDLLP